MATTHQRRPDGKAPEPRTLVEPRDRAALEAQLQKLDEQKRILEQRGEGEGLDPEVAARLQPAMGNAAIAGLLNRATDTATTQAGDAALEEKQDEEKEEEGEEKEAGEIEHVLPSFSTGGGGGGGGQPPWAMGRQLGGDDDDEVIEVAEAAATAWRPMPVLPDPDEEGELEELEGEDAPDDPDAIDLREAHAALGDAPWRPSLLSRGLRNARVLARGELGPEALVDAAGLDQSLGRARAMLRFVALHGDGLDAVLLAKAAIGAGEPVFPVAAGFSGATARALALVEVALASLPPGWARVLDVVADPRPRARVENVAVAVADTGSLSATALFDAVLGAHVAPAEVDLTLHAHPAAVAALTQAARLDPLPLVDLWSPPAGAAPGADPAVDALDAVLARFTGAAEPPGPGIGAADVAALFESMNLLLGAIGAALVEVAAAGVAVAPYADLPTIAGVLTDVERALRRAARRLYGAGEALEALLGTDDEERVRAVSADTLAVRSTAEVARQGAVATLATLLLDAEHAPPDLPELYARAEAEALAGRAAAARDLLDAAIVSAPPEQEGRVLLAAGGLLLRLGFPETGQLAEAAERLGGGHLAAGARSLSAGLSLARERWAAAEVDALAGLRLGVELGLPYVVADATCTRATAIARHGGDWRPALAAGAAWLREREEGGALNLLKARWGELAAGE